MSLNDVQQSGLRVSSSTRCTCGPSQGGSSHTGSFHSGVSVNTTTGAGVDKDCKCHRSSDHSDEFVQELANQRDSIRNSKIDDGTTFNSNLHACMRNLGLDFESMRQQRDRLLKEVTDLRREKREAASLHEAVRRLTNELAELREENNEFKRRELEALEDPTRVSRSDYDRVVAENAQLKTKFDELDQNRKYYGSIALRAAQLEGELADARRQLDANSSSSSSYLNENQRLAKENESLHSELNELRALQASWMKDSFELKDLRERFPGIEERLRNALTTISTLEAENQSLKGDALGSQKLVSILTQQMSDRSHDRAELESLRHRCETLTSKQMTWTQEKKDLEDLLKRTQDELAALQQAAAETRPLVLLGQRHEQLTKELEETKFALLETKRELLNEQSQSKTLAGQAKYWEEKYLELESKRPITTGVPEDVLRERDRLQHLYNELQSKFNELNTVLINAGGVEGLQELERIVKAMRKELAEEQKSHKNTEAELTKAKYDQKVTALAFRTLQTQNTELQSALDRANAELSGLRVEAQSLPGAKRQVEELQNKLQNVMDALNQARNEIARLQSELSARTNDLHLAAERLTQAANEWKREKQIMLKEIDNHKNELSNAIELVQRQDAYITSLKRELAEVSARCPPPSAGCNDRLCSVKGRRCPCKSRPPPPSRWQ